MLTSRPNLLVGGQYGLGVAGEVAAEVLGVLAERAFAQARPIIAPVQGAGDEQLARGRQAAAGSTSPAGRSR